MGMMQAQKVVVDVVNESVLVRILIAAVPVFIAFTLGKIWKKRN